jgi:phosphatidylglycerophosphatase A
MSALARVLGTWFYLGYVPKGPGTAGSLGAVAIAWALHAYAGISAVWLALFGVLLIAPAIWAAGRMAKDTGIKDPQIVVIDEVVGQWITLAGASTLNAKSWIAAFALFRLFDIWKPPPVRQLERIPGGTGIVLDDAMAGIYAALVLFTAGWFNLY